MSPQREDQYSCSLIKVEKDCEDDTDAVDTHNGYEYIVELEVKKEEPCETKEEQDTVSNAEHDGCESVHNTDVPVKDEIEIGPTVIQPQYIGSSLHTTDASKAELIQCGGADVALDTTTPGAASYRSHSTGSRSVVQIKKKGIGISCDICRRKCSEKSNLIRHMRLHTGDKPFACNICEYKCAEKSHLVQHIQRRHTEDKPFPCNICEYKCAAKSILAQHMRMHSVDKPFSCNICQYKCAAISILAQHIRRVHSEGKPFSCNICQYKCKEKSYLKSHMRIHTENKPFSCNICQYKCSRKSTLVRHNMLIHTGDKFSCNICEYKCAVKSFLTQHMRKHSVDKPFSCSICEYKCVVKSSLATHMLIHTGESQIPKKVSTDGGGGGDPMMLYEYCSGLKCELNIPTS